MSEKQSTHSSHEKLVSAEKSSEHYERAKHTQEQKAELSPERSHDIQEARNVAEHEALSKEETLQSAKTEKTPASPTFLTREVRQQSFNTTMRSVRKKLPKTEATFSKVIHNPTVDKVSDIAAETIGRPSAVYGGALAALIGLAITYGFARRNGFQLSGYEFVLLLTIGMLGGVAVELIVDAVKKLLEKRRR